MSEYVEIFTDYEDAKKAALKITPAYIFKFYSRTSTPVWPKPTVEKIEEY
jgi:hypothetical protein